MRRNPYRVIEHTFQVVITVLAVVLTAVVAITYVHVTSSWRGFGLIVVTLLLLIFACCIVSWWSEKRDKWDKEHSSDRQPS